VAESAPLGLNLDSQGTAEALDVAIFARNVYLDAIPVRPLNGCRPDCEENMVRSNAVRSDICSTFRELGGKNSMGKILADLPTWTESAGGTNEWRQWLNWKMRSVGRMWQSRPQGGMLGLYQRSVDRHAAVEFEKEDGRGNQKNIAQQLVSDQTKTTSARD